MNRKAETFFFSDPHFYHANIIKFGRPFSDVNEMNERIVKNWNETVTPEDKVWVLGDCVFAGKENLKIFERLNGRKFLVLGNHDSGRKDLYLQYFNKIEGAVDLGNGVLLTHIPVHPLCLGKRFWLNIHGHTHEGVITLPTRLPDPRYVCVSAEQVDYRPVTLEWIKARQNAKKNSSVLVENKQMGD